MAEGYQFINTTQQVPSDLTNFRIITPPDTDVWRVPPARDAFSGPMVYRILPASSFRKARVTVSAQWTKLYDQGGLIMVLPHLKDGKERQWVKAGTELVNNERHIAVVTADRWADWSLQPQSSDALTVEFERKTKDGGARLTSTLLVYIAHGDERRPVREVTWVFEDESQDIWIGAYAARPCTSSESLEVSFSNLIIDTV